MEVCSVPKYPQANILIVNMEQPPLREYQKVEDSDLFIYCIQWLSEIFFVPVVVADA